MQPSPPLVRLCAILWFSLPALAQVNRGEVRVHLVDPAQHSLPGALLDVSNSAAGESAHLTADAAGVLVLRSLPFGPYHLRAQMAGFAPTEQALNLQTSVPLAVTITLSLAPVHTEVDVSGQVLLDLHATGSPVSVSRHEIETRLTSLPGRSLQDLVNTEPGWLYEGNAVLHPRGSEYQTQVVLDGLPLLDNRSPGFGPEVEADAAQSLAIFTAGISAEYGRKLGGVIEVTTREQQTAGAHGGLDLTGGSFNTAALSAHATDTHGKNSYQLSGSGSTTAHYLNPVVPENFTNKGSAGDFASAFDRDLARQDHLSLGVRHEFSNFEVPNELQQQAAGQLQHGHNAETLGTVHYQHLFSPEAVLNLNGMVRDASDSLDSNMASTPIRVTQRNSSRQVYSKAVLSWHHGSQEWKGGLEADTTFLRENFADTLTNPDQFDDGTAPAFHFAGARPDLEQALFLEDRVSLGAWTISAGLRLDLYQLLLRRQALSPRLAVGRAFARTGTVLHGSYDRVFQTPSSENILLAGAAELAALNPDILRLPVEPSQGNYYEAGISQALRNKLRLDLNTYRRNVDHFADDDQLLNTGISYPIAFNRARIYGAEGKVVLQPWARVSGYASYSYMVGKASFPVTGGLFLGDDVQEALTQLRGSFPISQDQRQTVRARVFFQASRRVSLGTGLTYGSGLPFEFQGTPEEALASEGPAVIRRIDFARGRVRSNLSQSASLILQLLQRDRWAVRLQADADNLNNRLNVIDFGGLFSGDAIGPPRSFGVRLSASF